MKEVRLLGFNANTGEFKEGMFSELDDYYKVLECDLFDIVKLKVGAEDRVFDVFCDDEGLLCDNPKPSAFSKEGKVVLVGNLIFANSDCEGNTTELSDDDIEYITSNVTTYFDLSEGGKGFAIMPVSYC